MSQWDRIIIAQVNGLVYANMEEGMKNYGTEKHDGVTKTWDAVQREVGMVGSGGESFKYS